MPISIVDSPQPSLLHPLLDLVQNSCPYPACDVAPTKVVSLRSSRRESPRFENCLALCSQHASEADSGRIRPDMLKTIRAYLKPSRVNSESDGPSRILNSRTEYIDAICDALYPIPSELRAVYVGPLPFQPEWYFDLQVAQTGIQSMDRAVRRCLADRGCTVRLILRNHPRYLQKVSARVPSNLWQPFLDETIESVKELLEDQDLNNSIVCADVGSFSIPIIAGDVHVSAYRTVPDVPIEAGIRVSDQSLVQWERESFDTMFNHFSGTATSANRRAKLSDFLESL